MKNLQVAITTGGNLDVKRIDKVGVYTELKKYKSPSGAVNYPALFKIPTDQRIAAMAEKDLGGTIKIITVALTLAFETMNLSRPMTSFQILDLAEAIVDSAGEEDKPAIEDLMLFLQKLTRGEYGAMYESIDIPKFMMFFNKYRDERWLEGVKLRDAKDAEFKALGDPQREGRKLTDFEQHLSNYSTKLQARNDEIKELKSELRRR